MTLDQVIQNKIKDATNPPKNKLWQPLYHSLEKIIEDCKHHLSQITAQMKNYDIHDNSHSEKVLENIEALLGENISKLSFYEGILLKASCYLHDAAMALPEWEYSMLRAIEGTDEIFDNSRKHVINHDFKPVHSLTELVDYIKANRTYIYLSFKNAAQFIFACNSEDEFVLDLAERVVEYEKFRNGFSDKLKAKQNTVLEYLNYSELIRCEFIRTTHHTRIENYIQNLQKIIAKDIGSSKAITFIRDLSALCRGHGEIIKFVESLPLDSAIDNIGHANLQYLAMLLRLGDVIHFSSDRAPLSLFAEKIITDPTSLMHWNAKFQDTNYKIIDMNNKISIVFSSYCTTPEQYYFLQKYLDWIDMEISHYFSFYQNLEFINYENKERYCLPLAKAVIRIEVLPDTSKFIPENGVKFTLDQQKILTLLMGTQLYKDKYLCLRELYQNSLDACKCMIAYNKKRGIQRKHRIQFGLGMKATGEKYIYCLDDGTGMTREIVKNYLLHIGNSYYRSNAFISQNVDWSNDVNPTSQFGIGILSCYMIGHTLEITTKYYDERSDAFSFSLDGPNERFYYMPVNKLDLELIGNHGTLVKIILSDKYQNILNNLVPNKHILYIYGLHNHYFDKYQETKKDMEAFQNSLYYQINRQIGIKHPQVDLWVENSENDFIPIIERNEVFDYRNHPEITLDDVKNLWSEYHFFHLEMNPYLEAIECRDYIKDIPIQIEEDGAFLYVLISLPLSGIPNSNPYVFSFCDYVWHGYQGLLMVDGICVSDIKYDDKIRESLGSDLFHHSIINFCGENRPTLSIDRNSIVEVNDTITELCSKLSKKFIDEIVNTIQIHIETNKILYAAPEVGLIIDLVLNKFSDMSGEIIDKLSATNVGKFPIKGLEEGDYSIELNQLISSKELLIPNANIRSKPRIIKDILIGKMIGASFVGIDGCDVTIKTEKYISPSSVLKMERKYRDFYRVVVRADKWKGIYEEYDLVTNLWPVTSGPLFDIICEFENRNGYTRIKQISEVGNGLTGIAGLSAALINPKFGISQKAFNYFEKRESVIGRCENIINNFWLFELNNHGQFRRKEKKDYSLYVFISPDDLSEEDELILKDYIGNDDIYVQGVREGWSILFLGHDQKYYILPGIHAKSELVAMIPPR